MSTKETIDYLELPARDLDAAKRFFANVFGWSFVDYGPDYASFEGAGINGGFAHSELCARTDRGSVLVVFYSRNLEQTRDRIEDAGGKVIKPIFAFPGGRRFHFADPNDNEYAVWSDIE